MDDFVKFNKLYDCYEELLTEKEKEVFKDYYGEDLSLKEIADNKNVSRNAVYKKVKKVEKKLEYYENKIKLCKIIELINNFDNSKDIAELKANIAKIMGD